MTTSTGAPGRPISADDLYTIVACSDPQVSPDGKWVAWVQTQPHRDDDGYRGAIWIAPAGGGDPRQLTAGQYRDQHPRWSPDSTSIAFVSNRPTATASEADARPVTQVWTIAIAGGEAIQRTSHDNGASSPAWSPDGTAIAFVASDAPGEDETAAPTHVGSIADERVVSRISYRGDGKGYLEKYSHLWVAHLGSGESIQLTTGDVFDREPAWSPDSTFIAFTTNRTADRATEWGRSGIAVVPAAGGEPIQITPDDARFSSAAWSPDGSLIACLGHPGTNSTTNTHLWTVAPDGSELTDRTAPHDLSFGDSGMGDLANSSPEGPAWVNDSRLMALVSQSGETQVVSVDLETGSVEGVTSGKHRIAGFSQVASNQFVVRGNINRPFEIERIGTSGEFIQVSSANEAFLSDVSLVDAIALDVKSPDGTAIQAWVIPPHGFDTRSPARHPLILQIHGGPHSMYGYAMFHEMQLMAAKGYAVLFSNPRGSAGYGEQFMSCTRSAWGESDMPDVIAAVDAASNLPWIDSDRIGITGGSYGGYLTNWIIGHDQRFRAAVTQRCVSNFHSFVGTSDIGTTFGIHEFGGTPWNDADTLLKYSPISYVEDIETPLLILHSDQDLRCPVEQAEQLFASLKYLGKDVSFVRFPEEGHELSRSGKPSRRIARLHYLIGWFDQHL